jgi:hypothetical protein
MSPKTVSKLSNPAELNNNARIENGDLREDNGSRG